MHDQENVHINYIARLVPQYGNVQRIILAPPLAPPLGVGHWNILLVSKLLVNLTPAKCCLALFNDSIICTKHTIFNFLEIMNVLYLSYI